jgi:uncharacterized membrane protein YkvI
MHITTIIMMIVFIVVMAAAVDVLRVVFGLPWWISVTIGAPLGWGLLMSTLLLLLQLTKKK